MDYPHTRAEERHEELHGRRVADPYRWLEKLDASEVVAWVGSQNALTRRHIDALPERERFQERLEAHWDFERVSPPILRGERRFYTRNRGLEDHASLYWRDGEQGEEQLLLDPRQLSGDGAASLAGYGISPDGEHVAYGVSEGGSDWTSWRVRKVATCEDLSDRLDWVKFSGVSWHPSGEGFFYSRFPAPDAGRSMSASNERQTLRYHRIGSAQDEDELVYENPDAPGQGFHGLVSDDGQWLNIVVWEGTDTRTRVFVRALDAEGGPGSGEVRSLVDRFDAAYEPVGNDGTVFYLRSDQGATRGRLVAIDLERPHLEAWTELVPESDALLEEVVMVGDHFALLYQRDVHHQIEIRSLDGALAHTVELPGIGTVTGWSGRRRDAELHIAYSSFVTPTRSLVHRIAAAQTRDASPEAPRVDPDRFTVDLVHFPSKDGTLIPMSVFRRADLLDAGPLPTLLYGYGGFNVSVMPTWSPTRIAWVEAGGVFAQPALRGGGEKGRAWHEAGRGRHKQRVFDDFISAAEHLIARGHSRQGGIAISGASNGGLLVGACLVQRPELFGAALPSVGVMDMLRFHKFTIGWAWVAEYGSPDDPKDFEVLYAYSPYHNLKPGVAYPPTLVTTADRDDRVVPSHSFKFIARLQAVQAGPAPCLIRIESKAGHGAGMRTSRVIEEAADVLAFAHHALGGRRREEAASS